MIEIKPTLQHQSICPYSGMLLKPKKILWQGLHVCVISDSPDRETEILENLKVGHYVNYSYQADLKSGKIFGDFPPEWWGIKLVESLLEAIKNPEKEELKISKEVFKHCQKVIILNCIDYLYGHALLKLLNAQRHLENNPDCGLVVIVPNFLRWMVPEGVAEIWTVNISLKNSQKYYPSLDKFISEECERFEKIYISEAYSHPSKFNISKFTRVSKHSFDTEELKITFVWREDRIWCNDFIFNILEKTRQINLLGLWLQNWKVQKLFAAIKLKLPTAKFAIAGMGTKTRFPEWIEDARVEQYNEETERKTCQIYSQSRIVIGVHGSNMLLPSGHAGMTIDLMPRKRWGNFAQDILYQESDPRIAAFRYRYVPLETSIPEIAWIASRMVLRYSNYKKMMTADHQ